jgi:NAD(P)-dependent dehydrogenase (short-subunit alcohol dehydrogenase family)
LLICQSELVTLDPAALDRERPTLELFRLNGKTALVTGASGYLGKAISRALAEAGARVVVASRDAERAREVMRQLPAVDQGTHQSVVLDHLDEDQLEQGFREAVAAVGALDILVNNGHEPTTADWRQITAAQFNRQLANATGYFLLSRLLRDHVVSRRAAGSIVMLGSMYGVVGSYPEAYDEIGPASPVAYHALKGGIVQMTRHLAVYWAADRVRVNCLSPGPFPADNAPPRLVKRLQEKSPLGRMGRPEELKGAVVFLASDASSYVTGHNLLVDGGWTAW